MKLILRVNGKEYRCELDGSAKRRFRLDAEEIEADIERVEQDVYSILLDGRSYQARVEEQGASLSVWLDGRRLQVEVIDPRRWTRPKDAVGVHERQNVCATMPGKVVRVLVSPGDSVTPGQGLIVVEAMKMQNEMKALKAGRVAAVTVRQGDTVNGGQLLAVIE